MSTEEELKRIYQDMIVDAGDRLNRVSAKLNAKNASLFELEEAALHLRMALELIAFAAIAPNKSEYERIRSQAVQAADFTRDFHAKRIFQDLARINPDFFPLALKAPKRTIDGNWLFERRAADTMSRNQFEKIYDRLGRLTHARNPWGQQADYGEMQKQMASAAQRARNLIERHAAFIRTPNFTGCWLVQPSTEGRPVVLTAQAQGDFIVDRS
ncbi:MAG: hypothetical protein ACK4NP_04610 [Parvularculaceae bacterium]